MSKRDYLTILFRCHRERWFWERLFSSWVRYHVSWRPPVANKGFFHSHPAMTKGTLIDINTGYPAESLLPCFGDLHRSTDCVEECPASFKTYLPVPVCQKPEVPYLHEPVRKDMEQEPSDKLMRIEGHDLFSVSVSIILPGERNLFLLHADDTMVRNGNPVRKYFKTIAVQNTPISKIASNKIIILDE